MKEDEQRTKIKKLISLEEKRQRDKFNVFLEPDCR